MFIFLLFLIIEPCVSVIYNVNETEHRKIPPLYELDDYDGCMLEPGGVYCIAHFDLTSKKPSQLLNFIQEYSAAKKHYNYLQIHRGVCITSTCKDYLPDALNKTVDLSGPLEACINRTFYQKYELETKFSKLDYCKSKDDKKEINLIDIIVGVIILCLVLINIIGTVYSGLSCTESKQGNSYLMAFSIKRNWVKFLKPSGEGTDDRLNRLVAFHGARSLTMLFIIFSHTSLSMALAYSKNTHKVEMTYNNPGMYIVLNGNVITCTFFAMSSFLFAYNFQIISETKKITWNYFFKGVGLRLLRLTPSYAVVIGILGTWVRFAGDGPLWELAIDHESQACIEYWWAHVLYINNYIYVDDHCAPHTWYLAADTQLFCFALFVLVLARSNSARKVAVLSLLVASVLIVAAQTYFQDLDAIVLHLPETYRSVYTSNDVFKYIYIPGHTNLSTYIVGIAAALLVYHWQKENKDFTKLKSYTWVYWLLFPVGTAFLLSGSMFYMDGAKFPLWFRALYASTHKLIFQTIIILLLLGAVFKIENIYRGVLEWRVFTWLSRLTFSAYLVHSVFGRMIIGLQKTLIYVDEYHTMLLFAGVVVFSFISGLVLLLFVEYPVANIIRIHLTPQKSEENEEKNVP